jgi:hypothetical protein
MPGTIGYLEAGSGIDASLPEVSLKNKYGRTLNSEQAAAFDGIGAKEQGVLPEDPAADFGSVLPATATAQEATISHITTPSNFIESSHTMQEHRMPPGVCWRMLSWGLVCY